MSRSDIRTPEGFLTWVDTKKPRPIEFAAAVAELTDPERRKLSRTAQEFYKSIRKLEDRDAWLFVPKPRGAMARLALLVAAPRSAAVIEMNLKSVGLKDRHRWDPDKTTIWEQAAGQILVDRRPDWAQLWFEKQLGTTNGRLISWPAARRLLNEGLCEPAETAEYARFMGEVLVKHNLCRERELLDEIWRQFRLNPDFLKTWVDPALYADEFPEVFEADAASTETLLRALSEHDLISRDRLLDETLAGLWRDFGNSFSKQLLQIHDRLDPDAAERLARQSEYVRLLQNPTSTVVTFAIRILKSLRKEDAFDATSVLEALPAVFSMPQKSQPKAALSFIRMLTGKDKDRIQTSAAVVTAAIMHPELDVQEAALKLLEGWSGTFVPVTELSEVQTMASLSIRSRLDALLGGESSLSTAAEGVDSTGDLAGELFTRIEQLDAHVRSFWKLDESLSAAANGVVPPQVSVERRDPLAGLHEVHPVSDSYELIDLIAATVERVEDPMDVERILDGISRFGHEYPDDFSERVHAVIRRFDGDNFSASPVGIRQSGYILPALARLILTWLHQGEDRQPDDLRRIEQPTDPVRRLMDARADQLRQRIRDRPSPVPLLALPTHEFGWIDPPVFVERLRQTLAADADPWRFGRLDLQFALLRLARANRQAAIEASEELPEHLRRLVGCALAVNVEPSADDRAWSAEWVAAARSVDTDGDLPTSFGRIGVPPIAYGCTGAVITVDPNLCPVGRQSLREQAEQKAAPDLKPGGIKSGLAKLSARARSIISGSVESLQQQFQGPELPVTIHPRKDKPFADPEFIPILLAEQIPREEVEIWSDQMPAWAEEWVASTWPANPDLFLAKGLCRLLERIDDEASEWAPNVTRMRPLLRTDRDWTDIAISSIWLSLYSRDADCATLATDALVEGILDGRAHPDPLGDVLVQLFPLPWLKLNRLCERLRETARVSRWATLLVATVVDRAIAAWPERPRDAHHVLSLQRELLLELNSCLSADAKTAIAGIKGSSKTAKLAKQLLGLSGSSASSQCKSALLEGVAVRISRAEQDECTSHGEARS